MYDTCKSAKEMIDEINAKYPQADAIYEDTIINMFGVIGLNWLRELRMIESCGVINGRKLYAI